MKSANWLGDLAARGVEKYDLMGKPMELPGLDRTPNTNPAYKTYLDRLILDPGEEPQRPGEIPTGPPRGAGHMPGILSHAGSLIGTTEKLISPLLNYQAIPLLRAAGGKLMGSRRTFGEIYNQTRPTEAYNPSGGSQRFEDWWKSKFGNPYTGGSTPSNPGGTWGGKLHGAAHSLVGGFGSMIDQTATQVDQLRKDIFNR